MKSVIILLLVLVLNNPCHAQLIDSITNKHQLQAVTVTAKKTLVNQEVDRIVYDLQADPQSKVSSLLDMMRKVPYLSIDANDNILLKGSTGYKIFVNGRPSGLIANNPKEVLRSLPASTIKSIEVITNPPAKYDAEGLAGIINIITIRQSYNGYRGSVNISQKKPAGGLRTGNSFTLKQGKLNIALLAGINEYSNPETSKEAQRIGKDSSNLQQHTVSKSNTHNAYVGMELSYEVDSFNLISGQINWNNSRLQGFSAQTSVLTEVNDQQYYQLQNDNGNRNNSLDATINYQKGFKANQDQLLTFSYQYLQDNSDLYSKIAFLNTVNYNVPDYHQFNSATYTDHTAQVDYVQPIGNLIIEGGFKGIFRRNESNFSYSNLNPATGNFAIDTSRSNIFSNYRDVLSIYNSYNYHNAGWQFKLGIRAEETIIKIRYSYSLVPLQQQYLNVLPSILVNRKLNDNSSVGFSFSKRIQRPSTAELNPFIDRSDPNFITSGNPYLHPITSNVYELSYMLSAKATINISIGGMFFNDVFSAFPFYDPSANVTVTRYENYGKGRVIKTNLYVNYPITPKLNVILNADVRHIMVNGFTTHSSVRNSGLGVYAYTSCGYRINNSWRINADITYKMGGILLPMGTTNGFIASSFSINKDIIRKLTVSVTVINPFTKYRYTDETINSPDFFQTSHNQSYYRQFTINLNYNFGKLKEEIRKSKRGIQNENANR